MAEIDIQRIKKRIAFFLNKQYGEIPLFYNDIDEGESNFFIKEYLLNKTSKCVIKFTEIVLTKNNLEITIPISEIKFIYLNKNFKKKSVPKELHIFTDNEEYILEFNNIHSLIILRTDMEKIVKFILNIDIIKGNANPTIVETERIKYFF